MGGNGEGRGKKLLDEHSFALPEMKTAIVIILIFTSSVTLSRNDTIYLFENYIELNERTYNLVENDIKTGNWIEFNVEDTTFTYILGSGIDVHFHDFIITEYRPLRDEEFNGIEVLISENKKDIGNDQILYTRSIKRIKNRVPPDKYYITGKGRYKNDKKEGKWVYKYKNGKPKKEIFYENGIPKYGFDIYMPDKTIMIKLKKINDVEWEVIKYLKTGEEIERKRYTIDELNELY
ncbi:MAG TPA: hypothetical protein VLN45_00525 [Ignavibacteriaceae bacterium]|nr:hypothetical protein [Ignavibacteriaceae bacterium]